MSIIESIPDNGLQAKEVNFDGLVGPTHNYAGLAFGNVASRQHLGKASNPRASALQGLEKMQMLLHLGVLQGVLPPHSRPQIALLRQLGFAGNDHQVLAKAWQQEPVITTNCYSASAMWTANAATISPFPDTPDGCTHITAANLNRMFHRSFEHKFTALLLKTIFSDPTQFVHHQTLPDNIHFGDEGAANHTRFCTTHEAPGVEMFVYGSSSFNKSLATTAKYPARQRLEASQAIARLHGLQPERLVLVQQNPKVIDRGVFHNDVIATGHRNFLFFHEHAFVNTDKLLAELSNKFSAPLHFIRVDDDDISVETAVKTYLFNTQLIDLDEDKDGSNYALIAPMEAQESVAVNQYLQMLTNSGSPIKEVKYIDLRESMQNGGGPACLRLRIVMSVAQIKNLDATVIMNPELHTRLVKWVNKHYRDRLSSEDLRDPQLLLETNTALDELTQILNLGAIYDFQK